MGVFCIALSFATQCFATTAHSINYMNEPLIPPHDNNPESGVLTYEIISGENTVMLDLADEGWKPL